MFELGSQDVLRVRVCDVKYNCLTVITAKPKPAVRSLVEEIQRENMARGGRIDPSTDGHAEGKRARRTTITRMVIMG
jgi:hypothetical protein